MQSVSAANIRREYQDEMAISFELGVEGQEEKGAG